MDKNLLESYSQNRKELQELRDKLNEINSKKEIWFKKKEGLKKEISAELQKIKEIKSQNDKDNLSIQELKKERDKYNAKVKKLIEDIKNINNEKQKALQKYKSKIDPFKIQERINELETKIETETSFKKEQKLMEEIKKLKKIYIEAEEIIKIREQEEQIEEEIKGAKKKADEFHKQITLQATGKSYSDFIILFKVISNLKKTQQEAFQKFIDLKNEYMKILKELKEKLNKNRELKEKIDQDKELKEKIEKEKEEKIIEEKEKELEKKLKTKKRITTEDLFSIKGE